MTIVKARVKYTKSSARKLSRVLDLLRGKTAREGMVLLKFLPQKGARIIEKVLKSAIANAKNNFKLAEEKLVISECYANRGFVMKRFQPRARGRAFPIKKPTAHVTVCLEDK